MNISYHSWLVLTITKHLQTFQPLLTTSIHLCPFWDIFGYFWPFLATCDPFQSLLMTISYHSWLFLTITKHFQTFHPLLTTSIHLCPFQPFSDIFGHFWLLVTPSSHLTIDHPARWPFLTTPDYFWPVQSISSQFQPHPAISGHIQPFLAIFGHFWPFLTTCDPFWPLPPTSDDPFWPLMTISDHLKVPNCRWRHLAGDYYIQLT